MSDINQTDPNQKFPRTVWLGAVAGMMAWSAYAVVEFVASSLVFRAARPYAIFTSWHWGLTGMLAAAYLATGALAGVVAGVAVYFFSRPAKLVLERAATLSLVIAFAASLILAAVAWSEKIVLLIASVALAALLLAAIRSDTWSRRIGLLCNPWVVSALLLGIGQGVALLQLQTLAEQLGGGAWRWLGLVTGAVLAVAAGSILLGRWWLPRLAEDSFFPLNWAALVLGFGLLAISMWLARAAPPLDPLPSVTSNHAQPNVLLIVMDTVRADHLSLYGYGQDTTPNLKQLAQDSAVYTEAISASDFTLTSHATLFTGMYGSWHGARCQPPDAIYGRALAPQVPTLAEMLSTKGYRTLGVAANLYLRSDFGLQRGFQDFRIPRPVPVLAAESWYMLRNQMRRILGLFADTSQFDRLYSDGGQINRDFFAVVKRTDLSRVPFFAFLNYMDAHFPYIPPAPFDRRFPGKDGRLRQDDLEAIQGQVLGGGPLPSVYSSHSISQYDGGIAYIDAQIGELIRWLRDQNLYDNTMIIVTSDHGEAFGEKRLFLHANSTYQNLLHVALLVKYPHSAHRGVVNEPVSLTDVVPTVLETLGYPVLPTAQGRSLLQPAAFEPREIFGESFPCPVLHSPDCPEGCTARALISWPNKFITSSNGKYEAYDLSNDPSESRNLFGSLNPVAQKLRTELTSWVKGMPAQSKQQLKLDPEALQRLKSLGYIGGR